MLKKDSTDKQKATFLQEAAIMAQFRHPHIVRLLGAVTVDEPVSDGIASCMVALYPLHLSYQCILCAVKVIRKCCSNASFKVGFEAC